jgi:hypothetical protein
MINGEFNNKAWIIINFEEHDPQRDEDIQG